MKGVRADARLFDLGKCESREKARALIMHGVVYIGEVRIEKPGQNVAADAELTVREDPIGFVSRGGLKLEKAITKYDIDVSNLVALDIGASTGGFTDCMLKHGARKVYSIDVGYGQLDWRLRNDERVVVMERTNARFMEPNWFVEGEEIGFASMDVSFISIKLMLKPIYDCLCMGAMGVFLVKPQFEAGREKVGKNGVVHSESTHKDVLKSAAEAVHEAGFTILNMDYSPITGPKGNMEFLLVVKKELDPKMYENLDESINSTVYAAHENFKSV